MTQNREAQQSSPAAGFASKQYTVIFVTRQSSAQLQVKSSKFEEMVRGVHLLNTFVTEMGDAFYEFIQTTAQAQMWLIKLLTYLI